MNESLRKRLRKAVDKSGFPLQLKLEKIIYEIKNWTVSGREVYWELNGHNGFIDTVYDLWLSSKKIITEVKKTSGGEWIFLVEKKANKNAHSTINLSSYRPTLTDKFNNEWNETAIDHHTKRSAFCIVSGQDENNPMLERLCTNLLMATEAFAKKHIQKDSVKNSNHHSVSYYPVIVTNTPMYQCIYKPTKVNLSTGELTEEPEFEEIKSIAFQKPFWSAIENGSGNNYSSDYMLNQAQDRTVFIVHTTAVAKFLADLDPRILS
jgi:hypothetical protein